jgi:PilZ domain
MRVALASGVVDEAGGLVAELRAIEQWDAAYWRNPSPETYETVAFVARAKRRCEILSQLLSIIPRLHNRESTKGREGAVDRQEIVPREGTQTRRHTRLELEAELIVRSESGLVPGRALDISESGMSAILAVQLQVGATVELKIKLPMALATTRAVVRSRNVFRHGFEFLQPLRDVVGHEVTSNDCQSCGGTDFILQAVAGVQGVTLTCIRCPNCEGVGRSTKQAT